MKITLFTSSNQRHCNLINLLSKISKKLFVIQEKKKSISKKYKINYPNSNILKEYFKNVSNAEKKIFKKKSINKSLKNINLLSINQGELKNISLNKIKNFFKSDIYIVFGCSFIKGELAEILISKKAINIHAGISPYYRGSDCNFWALYDNNLHLVGTTIHLLSKGLDSGPILYHAMPKKNKDPFLYTMLSLKSAFLSLVERINDGLIFKIKPKKQKKSLLVRYTRKVDLNSKAIEEYNKKKIDIKKIKFNEDLLKEPYYLS